VRYRRGSGYYSIDNLLIPLGFTGNLPIPPSVAVDEKHNYAYQGVRFANVYECTVFLCEIKLRLRLLTSRGDHVGIVMSEAE